MKNLKLLKLSFLIALLFGASTLFAQDPPDPINTLTQPHATACGIYDVDLRTQQYIDISNISMTLNLGDLAVPVSYPTWDANHKIGTFASGPLTKITLHNSIAGNPQTSVYINGDGQLKLSWHADIDFGTGEQESFTLPDNTVLWTLEFDINGMWGTAHNLAWDDVLTIDCELSGPGGLPIYDDYWNDLLWIIQNQLSITGADITPFRCPFAPMGAIDLHVSGGIPPYTYVWTGTVDTHVNPVWPPFTGATTQDLTGLFPGSYQVTVYDAKFCEVSSGTYIVAQEDVPAPVVPADDGSTVACLSNVVTPTPPTLVDVCGTTLTPTLVIVNTPNPVTCEGTIAYVYTYTDYQPKSSVWTYTYTVEYEDFTMPADAGSTIACASLLVTPTPPVVNDNCGFAITPTGPVVSSTPACEGDVTYVWTYTDCEGNTHDWTYTYTIEYEDFTMPADAGSTIACASLLVTPTPPVVNDNCGFAITPTGPVVSSTPACEGDVTYVWTYTDCEGNTHDWTYTYTIEYEDFTMPADAGSTIACASLLVTPTPPVVNDNCGFAITPTGPVVSSTPACEGDVTYVWTYTDCEGNTHDWTYTYTIEYEDFTMPADAGSTIACASLLVTPTPPVVNDNCGFAITPTGPVVSSTPACEGDVTYVWTYTDCEGNTHDWTYTYTIEYEDFTMPADAGSTIACASLLVTPTPPVVNDNCGFAITPTGPIVSSTPACEGDVTYVWTYTDCEGNTHDWTYTYTIEYEDFTMPADDGSTIACASLLVTPTPPVVNDNCGFAITPTGPVVSSTPACEGDVTYVWNYADCEGNTHDWTYTYTIEYLTFTMPADDGETIECASALYEPTPPTVNDNCGDPITPTGPIVSSTPACEGDVTYVWNYMDCEGSNYDWTYTFTIDRTTVPAEVGGPVEIASTVECIGDAVAPGTVYQAGFAGDFDPVNWTLTNDNGGDGSVDVSLAPASIELTGSDNGSGFNYTYYSIIVPIDGTVAFDWNYTSDDLPGFDGFGYEVDGVETFLSVTSGESGSVSINVTQGSAFAFFVVTADGIFGPGVTITDAFLFSSPAFPVIADVCGNILDPVGPVTTNNIVDCEGTIIYTYTYTDCADLEYIWSYIYTVDDTQDPTITCPADIEVFMNDGCTWILDDVVLGTPVVDDNCDLNPTVSNDAPANFPEGLTIVTWTVEDCAGNSATCTQNVTVLYNTLSGKLVYHNIGQFIPQDPITLLPKYRPMDNVDITLYEDAALTIPKATVTTDADGNFEFPGLCATTYYTDRIGIETNKLPGGVNTTDAGQMSLYLEFENHTIFNGGNGIEPVRWLAGDANPNGAIVPGDVLKTVLHFVYGAGLQPFNNYWNYYWATTDVSQLLLDHLTGPTHPMSTMISPANNTNTIVMFAQCTGDFNGNFANDIGKSASENLVLDYRENMLVNAGSEFELPIYAAMDMEVGAASLIMNFPSSQAEITGVFLTSDPSTPVQYNVEGNELRIGWYTLVPVWVNKGESLITLQMKLKGETSSEGIQFSLAADPLNELADGNFNEIEEASLLIDIPSTSSMGTSHNLAAEKIEFSNHPNPFKGITTFEYSLPVDGQVIIEVYDLVGNKVKVALNETQSAGDYSLKIDVSNLHAGLYTAILKLRSSDDKMITRAIKMINR